ncbi:Serine protease 7 [Sergentomyia squamirostris]
MNLRHLLPCFVITLHLVINVTSQKICRTNSGTRGECVSVYDCPPLLNLLRGAFLTPDVVTELRRAQCSRDPNESSFVCCERTTQSFSRPSQIFTSSNNQGDTIDICGLEGTTNRILGGVDTNLNEFPWMVLLEYERRNGTWTQECGGFLINRRYVVTAAHCVLGKAVDNVGRLVNVRIGEYNTDTDPDCYNDGGEEVCNDPVLNLGVEDVIPHENYIPDTPSNNQNDIALIRLSGNVQISESVMPICLPSSDYPGTPVGQSVTIAGWGQTLEQTRSSVKMKVNIPIVSFDRCQREYSGRTNLSPQLQICAGGNYVQDACFRDSGGPLISRENGLWIAEGIVSFGIGCGLEISSVYTRVSAFVPWIRSNMRP